MAKPKAEFRARVKAPTAEVAAAMLGESEAQTSQLQTVVPLRRLNVETSKRRKLSTPTGQTARVRKPRVPKQLTDGRETIAITLHLSPQLHKALRLQAVEEDMPMSSIAERVLGKALKP